MRISEGVEQALHFADGRIIILDIELAEKSNKSGKQKELERGLVKQYTPIMEHAQDILK